MEAQGRSDDGRFEGSVSRASQPDAQNWTRGIWCCVRCGALQGWTRFPLTMRSKAK
jgi:hypothetical protein